MILACFLKNTILINYCFLRVLMPNGRYKGQKPIKPVKIKIPDKINPTIAQVPLSWCVKYSVMITKATSTLMILSVFPMFFFILSF
jgi:diketogulonate reductase-like aldo/keto reductase